MLNDKTILITGGTGSFGNQLVRNLLKNHKPKKIIIFSRDELKQFDMYNKFREHGNLRFFLGDVRDLDRLKQATSNVDIIFHAAALKQVSSSEYNPFECIKTNIHGAQNVIQASIENEVKYIVALSTDKAGNPINLYGATKLVSDKLFTAANNISGINTLFSVVRYGNVAGSRGSVIPYFRELIKNNSNTLPVTHEEMTRFWINLNQGVDFVIKSLNRMLGGEIFIPIIPSFKITDLASAMAPDKKILYTGIRPGEKIHEILCPRDDAHLTYKFSDHYVISPSIRFFSRPNDFSKNKLNEEGVLVEKNFEYSSSSNEKFFTIPEIQRALKDI